MILTYEWEGVFLRAYGLVDEATGCIEEKPWEMGGTGLTMARNLANRRDDVHLLCALGPKRGKLMAERLDQEGLEVIALKTKEDNQETLLIEGQKTQRFSTAPPRMTQEEVRSFWNLFDEELQRATVLLVPPHPVEMAKEALEHGLDAAIPTVIAPGRRAKEFLESRPFCLVLRKEELEDVTGLKISFGHEVLRASRMVLQKGVGRLVVLSRDGQAIMVQREGAWKVKRESPKPISIDTDAVALALAQAILRQYDRDMTLSYALAAGIVGMENLLREGDASLKAQMQQLRGKELYDDTTSS